MITPSELPRQMMQPSDNNRSSLKGTTQLTEVILLFFFLSVLAKCCALGCNGTMSLGKTRLQAGDNDIVHPSTMHDATMQTNQER